MDSTAYHLGQIFGVVIFFLLLLGGCAFFIVAVIKASTRRSTGWIVAAALSSLPLVFLLAAFLFGVAKGFRNAVTRSSELSAARQGGVSQLLTVPLRPVNGNNQAYTISLPNLSAWQKSDAHPPFDYLFSYHDAYLGIVAEGIGSGSPEKICEIARDNLKAKAANLTTTTPTSTKIDSKSWLTFDAEGAVNGIHIKYRFYVYGDSNYTFQIISWTSPALFVRYAPVFDRVAQSFHLPN